MDCFPRLGPITVFDGNREDWEAPAPSRSDYVLSMVFGAFLMLIVIGVSAVIAFNSR
jgi:hypothetical protein